VWQLSGEAGNVWYQAEVPISSPSAFRIVIVGKVGRNNLGDIAIDDVSLIPGSCPSKCNLNYYSCVPFTRTFSLCINLEIGKGLLQVALPVSYGYLLCSFPTTRSASIG